MCALRVPAMAATGFAAQSILRRVVPSFLSSRPTSHVVGDVFSGTNLILRTPLHPSAFGICSLPQAIKGDADILLKGVGDKNTIEDVKRIVELAKRASLRREVLHTDFLTPPVLKESMLVLERLADLKTVAQGGYPEAERCRLSVGHAEALTSDPDNVAALSISGNFSFQPCSHGDFLGTGIARNKLGDILLQGEKGAQVLVVPELSDFLVSALDKVGNVSVSCKKIPLLALEYEPPRTKSSKSIEASLRLDAVASAGFKVSRTKMASLIRSSLYPIGFKFGFHFDCQLQKSKEGFISPRSRCSLHGNYKWTMPLEEAFCVRKGCTSIDID
ncbi:hypothetical protein KY290_011677 [Solanum tuberosum]|uniref:Ribosome-associated protein quality control protein P2 RNA-binding domain-containing protein n=1 Tax=Solanum tuberosum TaxID=4113 RepID=A0ABQ7W3H5_SOLTU|nr:hypothetical protein KY290_011677 [Solanum tuberosum]